MADQTDSGPDPDADPEPLDGELVAEVRALPVLAGPDSGAQITPPQPATLPATVAAATGGFLLGVAAFVLVRVLRRPSPARLARRRGRLAARRRGVDVQATRSFLVDVHLLEKR